MIGNSVLKASIGRCSKECGQISEGGKLLAGIDKVGDFIVNKCIGFTRKNHVQCVSGIGHFLTGIENCNNEYCI